MKAKASMMGRSLDKPKEPAKLKKQHSLILNNHDTNANERKDSKDADNENPEDKFKQFEGEGVVFKTKLIGSELVMEPRGDKMCQNSIQRLKAIIKGQKAHKKRIVMKISYDGVKIYDEKTNELLYHHEVPQISFISSDDTDSRTFGYVCDCPNKAHQFICFKTSGPALQVMTVISGLFEAVLELKKKKDERDNNDNNNSSTSSDKNDGTQQSDSMLDDQLIIHDTGSTEKEEPEPASNQSLRQESATEELTKQLGHALSFSSSSPLDLFEGGDSGIIDSPSTTLSDWTIPPPPPLHQRSVDPFQSHGQPQTQSQPQRQPPPPPPVSIPSFLSLNSSSPVTVSTVQRGTQAINILGNPNRGALGHHNRSLVYNHSSVSLNDAALSNRSAFVSPVGSVPLNEASLPSRAAFVAPMSAAPQHTESTDRYAVFNQIDNLPSIFESTSSLNSTSRKNPFDDDFFA